MGNWVKVTQERWVPIIDRKYSPARKALQPLRVKDKEHQTILAGAPGTCTSNPPSRRMHPDPSKSRAQTRQSQPQPQRPQRWFFTYERPSNRQSTWPESVQCWVIRDGNGSNWVSEDRSRVSICFENVDFGKCCKITLYKKRDGKQCRFELKHDGSDLPPAERAWWPSTWGGCWDGKKSPRSTFTDPQLQSVQITFTSETDSQKIDTIHDYVFEIAKAMFETNLKGRIKVDDKVFIDKCVSDMMTKYKKHASNYNYNAQTFWDRSAKWISKQIDEMALVSK